MNKIKVMTFNLRVEVEKDGINHLHNRKNKIASSIFEYAPDLIGFQEASDETRAWLRNILTDYTVIGCGRTENYHGESTPLAFRNDKFFMLSSENFWLSSYPTIPGSIYEGIDQSIYPRMCTVATLVHIESGKKLLFLNTHTDHLGALARTLASSQILQYVSNKGLPTVITGDFNAQPDSMEIKMITSNSIFPLADLTANIKGSFHNFGRLEPEKMPKIDYIFSNLTPDKEKAFLIPDEHENDIYISDHHPIITSIRI